MRTGLRQVRPVGHSEVLRLLAKRNTDIGDHRTQVVCRMHALLLELDPGGIAKEINASDVDGFLAGCHRRLRRRRSATSWRSSSSTTSAASTRSSRRHTNGSAPRSRLRHDLTEVFGIGPIIAAMLIGYTGDIARFPTVIATPPTTAPHPVEFSSGGRTVHRLSQRGNRQLNHALHMAAICQLRHPTPKAAPTSTAGSLRARRRREAIRALKRQISNTVYRHLVADARPG